jgi:hypothetical protein
MMVRVFLSIAFLFPYAVSAGTYAHIVEPTNARSGPGADYALQKVLRAGSVVEIADSRVRNGEKWYRIAQDSLRYPERVNSEWYVLASKVRVTHADKEYFHPPLAFEKQKRILIDRSSQMLFAYEGDELFLQASVSTGLKATPTPRGVFVIFKKQPSRYMQGPLPFISEKVFDLPGVPWTMYFTAEGAAIHGTYWHANYGRPWSNGCVNLPTSLAEKLYRWAPVGTMVTVRD